ncbi:hypothetical protein GQ43DRAFT_15391 [Delitschia confertaspora ATCC 74209]|uniref:Uncharacterized protein n=1 Tax=Delitschia confertaspora ATCC 74209 TaxID=1513339 RepID=A0A9P4MTK8_9PLEO|nr:hypothetical protein GQ43DRAFT_15391 [Delitschia confertaspora ATCC 74209]
MSLCWFSEGRLSSSNWYLGFGDQELLIPLHQIRFDISASLVTVLGCTLWSMNRRLDYRQPQSAI